MIHRINVFLLSLIIAFAPVYLISTAYAATPKWVLDYIKAEKQINEKKRLKAQLVKQINESGTKKTITAVVETVPTASKVGSAMIKRIYSPAGVVGVAAVTSLLNGIGWVMEEGTYVKKIPQEQEKPCENESCQWLWRTEINSDKHTSSQEACDYRDMRFNATSSLYKNQTTTATPSGKFVYFQVNGSTVTVMSADCVGTRASRSTGAIENVSHRVTPYAVNPDYQPSEPKPDIKIPLTAGLLGAMMIGQGYQDPDPNFDNDTVNTGDWTGVEDSYKEDPSGIGNELNDELQDKAERAKPTPDNKPAPIGSPDYDKEPVNDDDNDRKWDEDGNEGKTENTEKTDPETGDVTSEGKFTLPKFCDWAFTVCEWYEDWQESDKKLHDHLDETSRHQSDEKSFWSSVRSWFDWTKEEPELTDETLEIEQHEVIPYVRENHVSFNAGCPFSPETAVIELGILGNLEFQKDLTFICTFGDQSRPYIQGLGYLGGLVYLLVGIRNGNG